MLRWLGFAKKVSKLTDSIHSTDALDKTSEAQRPQFGTHEACIKRAFYKVIEQTDIPQDIHEALYTDYRDAHWSGSSREEEKVFKNYLMELDWTWKEFDKWKKKFNQNGEWPYMWRQYPEIYMAKPFSTENTSFEIKHLRVADMKIIAKKHNAQNLQKREELEKFMIKNISVEEILKTASARVEEQTKKFTSRRKVGKCKLLMHTIGMTAYSIRDAEQRKKTANSTFMKGRKLIAESSGCPVEEQFAKKFNDGELKKLPPFFPGDRTMVRRESLREPEE